jgi:hypothetical protein
VKVWSKSVCDEWHFTREHKTVFLLYLASHSRGATETSSLEVPTHALQQMKVWSKSVVKEGHFTCED